MKFCKDCRHYEVSFPGLPTHACYARGVLDRVTGFPEPDDAHVMRQDGHQCGPLAVLFEERLSPPQNVLHVHRPSPTPVKDYAFFKYEYQFFLGAGVGMAVGCVVLLVRWLGQ